MKANQVEINQCYKADSPLLIYPFTGKVIKKGEYSAILSVEQAHLDDAVRINELNKVIVVAYKDMIDNTKNK